MSKDRQQEKARRSREKLLEAAGKLFSEKKISDVGVREIASAAGCTTGTFYHYFTGKDDMIDQLYQDHDIEMEGFCISGHRNRDRTVIRSGRFLHRRYLPQCWRTDGNLPATASSRCESTAMIETGFIWGCRN